MSRDSKLPFIIKSEEEEDLNKEACFSSSPGRLPLHPSLGSPCRQSSLTTMLGEELRHINMLGRCRSPTQGFRGRSPSPQPAKEELSPNHGPAYITDSSSCYRPAKLLIPSLTCVSPLDLSPRCDIYPKPKQECFHKESPRSPDLRHPIMNRCSDFSLFT